MHCRDSVGNIKSTPIQQVIHGAVLADMREHMAQGAWHPACSWCQELEATTGASGRTVRAARTETLAAIDADPANYFELEHIVVNWSNLCNLSCTYCNAETSTAWQSIQGIPITHVKNEHPDLIELARKHGHTVVGLTLGGGEPLLQKGLIDFLQCLNPEQVNVMVTTNLSMDISKNLIYNELRSWPRVDWMISFDNADPDRFEYVRNGANWQTFVANIHLMQSHAQHIIAHPAYSIYCAMDLVRYYEFCVAEGLDVFWCELMHPWDLDIRRYPVAIRQQAIAEIDRVLERYGTTTKLAVHTLASYRNQLLDNTYLFNPDYQIQPHKWHQHKELELNKTATFAQLWPQYDCIQ
jgi:organic radical activating enzyme